VPVAKYGYLGVDLFFMISGFVIFMTVSDGTLRHYVVSRVTKLYPAFWICCTITFVVSLGIGGERFPVSVMQYLVNMLCLGGVFGVAAIDGAYWSHQGIGYMVFNAASPAINYRLAFWGMIFLALVLAYVVHVPPSGLLRRR
jgi:peptidoglycan/LPS O-acetylase OafA/YrhL